MVDRVLGCKKKDANIHSLCAWLLASSPLAFPRLDPKRACCACPEQPSLLNALLLLLLPALAEGQEASGCQEGEEARRGEEGSQAKV